MLDVMILEKLQIVRIRHKNSFIILRKSWFVKCFWIVVENAKLFKEDLLRRNVKNSNALNLQSLRLGINSIIALSNALQNRKYEKLNLADNAISDYGMHAIKNIINNSG